MSKLAAIIVLLSLVFGMRADDRIWVAVRINGKPLVLIFDTGSEGSALFPPAAERLGLTNFPAVGMTEECDFSLGTNHCRMWFDVLDPPNEAGVDFDGLLGWTLWRSNILQLDAITGQIQPLETLPAEVATWTKVPLRSDFPTLALDIGDRGGPAMVLIDTGIPGGVELSSDRWLQWRKKHANAPATLVNSFGYWTNGNRIALAEVSWASSLDLGPLHLTEVPVNDVGPARQLAGTNAYAATLGLAALKRLDFIIDGPNGVAYLRPRRTPALPFDHDRAALGFIPPASPTNRLVLRVLKGGPAYEAGIRDGDVLLTYQGNDVKRLTDFGPLGGSNGPPGTKMLCTLARGSKEVTATVVLRDLIGPPFDAAQAHPPFTNDFAKLPVHLILTPYDLSLYTDHAKRCTEAGRFDMAIADLTASINACAEPNRHAPSNMWQFLFRGCCYVQTAQFNKAILDLTDYLSIVSTDPEAYAQRGTAYARTMDLTNAIKDLTQALHFGTTNTFVSFQLGWAYVQGSNYDKSIIPLTDFLKVDSTNGEAYTLRGIAYARTMDATNAIKDLTLALRLDPDNAWACYYLGLTYEQTGDYKRAKEFAERALNSKGCPPELRGDIEERILNYLDKEH
ncbi:MAG TPA: aspartyl protease family protein [Verrucomicrobiae bacterium]|jgi:Flp pilus assembly protein TadD|nr:aspartyl protease family protein [Verrucomicrobiae bacterium]